MILPPPPVLAPPHSRRGPDEDPCIRPDACYCVLVDTEPRAVRRALAATPSGRRDGDGAAAAGAKSSSPPEAAMLRNCPAIYGHSGRGNNWAHGYRQPGEGSRAYEDEGFSGSFGGSGARADGRVLVDALRAIRRMMDPAGEATGTCARAPPDILLIYSLAGGTGSGLGSRLLHELRMAYPKVLRV